MDVYEMEDERHILEALQELCHPFGCASPFISNLHIVIMELEISFKSLVIEAFRKLNLISPEFTIVYNGPPHDRRFKCHLRVDDTHFGFTHDKIFTSVWKKTLKQAENSAAESLLLYMGNLNMITMLDLHRSIVNEYKAENDELVKRIFFYDKELKSLRYGGE
ncbi:hypothetical protein FNV43_RR19613 [Rhamnella rubrinervis]|uniref:DRBM domain-containing protein n=1 Tax=Rhamnella rubrinervis TaxID=2594499 RepID=A0A8K0DZZ2_9ROSA|nr:hypothetical protein FNV43_RR19613 [Rhamnella rubrinervis]